MMKQISALIILCAFFTYSHADTHVRGHIRKDGKYVEGHTRSNPNNRRYDNLNSKTRGTNPYTGKQGRQRDEFSSPPASNKSRRR